MVLDPQLPRRPLRLSRLIESLASEADGESLHLFGRRTAHQHGERARINAAAQEHAERHVAGQSEAHRLLQPPGNAVMRGSDLGLAARAFERQLPILPKFGSARADGERVRRRQRHYALDDGQRILHRPEHEVRAYSREVEPSLDQPRCEKGVHFRGEDELAALLSVVERLYAEAVANEEEFLAAFVPYGGGEHPPPARDAIAPPDPVRL